MKQSTVVIGVFAGIGVAAILSVSGFPAVPFSFLGFPPSRHGERARWYDRFASRDETRVLFSSNQTGVYNVYSVPVTGGVPANLTSSTTDTTYAQVVCKNDGTCGAAPCLFYRGMYAQLGWHATNWLVPYARFDWRAAEHRLGFQYAYESYVVRTTLGVRVEPKAGLTVGMVCAGITTGHSGPPAVTHHVIRHGKVVENADSTKEILTFGPDDVFIKGGNAIDAAVTAAAVLAVIEPTMNGVGGDLFAIVYDAKTKKLFWRGTATYTVTSPESLRASIDDAARQLVAAFPPAPKK